MTIGDILERVLRALRPWRTVKEDTLKPLNELEIRRKAPSQLWLNRRESMLQFGYDPRDTAEP